MARQSEHVRVWRARPGADLAASEDRVASEEPLEIRIAGRPLSVTMRTPGHDEELAAGFLVGEGVIRRRDEIEHIRRCDRAPEAAIDVIVTPGVAVDFARLTRHVFASSSCGVCGAATIEAVRRTCPPVGPGPAIDPAVLHGLADRLREAQPTFDVTGGLHAAGLFDTRGRLVVAREDIGRHNAVDKVIGHEFLAGRLPLLDRVLLVSGRASFEIIQKALGAGIPIVAAVSAPSSLAIELAEEANLTLVGFLRPGGFNVYTHPERVAATPR